MNQAEKQFVFDLQLFAEEAEAAAEPQAAETAAQETEDTEAPAAEPQEQESAPEAPDYSQLGSMSQSDQLSFLKKHGFVETNAKPKAEEKEPEPPTKTEEDKPEDAQGEESQADEQTYEIKVDGETRKLTLKELIAQAQMGADYTKKTQALAESRRQVDAMMAALQVQKASQPQQTSQQPQQTPADSVKNDYEQAVRVAEQRLGLKPGEFNQFDPMHQFALNRIMAEHEAQQARETARLSEAQTEIRAFIEEANRDPETPEINDNFNRFLFAMGAASAEGAQKAQRIANAENALFQKKATKEDCQILRAHWKYVKEQLAKEKAAQQAQAAPKPEPPKTETPGNGRQAQTHAVFDMHKLGSMNTQQQLRALKQLGIFNMKG